MSQDRLRVGPQDSTYLSQLLWLEVPGGGSEESWCSTWYACSHTLSYSASSRIWGWGEGDERGRKRGRKERGRSEEGREGEKDEGLGIILSPGWLGSLNTEPCQPFLCTLFPSNQTDRPRLQKLLFCHKKKGEEQLTSTSCPEGFAFKFFF